MKFVEGVDRWIVGFEKKHGVGPEDALFRFLIRRPLRFGLIVLSIICGFPFLFGCATGVALGHWWR
jgi:hypothetical protein